MKRVSTVWSLVHHLGRSWKERDLEEYAAAQFIITNMMMNCAFAKRNAVLVLIGEKPR